MRRGGHRDRAAGRLQSLRSVDHVARRHARLRQGLLHLLLGEGVERVRVAFQPFRIRLQLCARPREKRLPQRAAVANDHRKAVTIGRQLVHGRQVDDVLLVVVPGDEEGCEQVEARLFQVLTQLGQQARHVGGHGFRGETKDVHEGDTEPTPRAPVC